MSDTSDLSELFARNPLNLTDADISVIIQRQREAQSQYELGATAPKKAAAPKKPTAASTLLKELGL